MTTPSTTELLKKILVLSEKMVISKDVDKDSPFGWTLTQLAKGQARLVREYDGAQIVGNLRSDKAAYRIDNFYITPYGILPHEIDLMELFRSIRVDPTKGSCRELLDLIDDRLTQKIQEEASRMAHAALSDL